MEDTLRESYNGIEVRIYSLNPCFNGRYSQSTKQANKKNKNYVLILVLMEDTLRATITQTTLY